MALLEQPIITIYAPDGGRVDWLRAPASVTVTPRWWDIGTAELRVQATDPRVIALRTPGSRIQIELRGEHLLGGPVTGWSTDGPPAQEWAFTVTDDAQVLDRILCWPSPAAALGTQKLGADTRTGALESVIKSLVQQNSPHIGVPIDIAADKGRGPTVTTSARWQPLSEVIDGPLRASGMTVTVQWRPETRRLQLDVAEQSTYPVVLSPETRTVTAYRLSAQAPTATRVILGPTDGTVYQQVTNTRAETEWGTLLGGAVFAAADTTDEASTAGSEALNHHNSRSGMSVSLSESGLVRYGGVDGLHVGDQASIQIGETTITDVVREVTLTWAPDKPLTLTPAIGGWDDNPVFELADAVRRAAATIRRTFNR